MAALVLAVGLVSMYFILVKIKEQEAPSVGAPLEALTAPADGTIAVSVDDFGFTPFSAIPLRVGGLDPEAATAVVFTSRSGERLTVPVPKASTPVINVPVPPIFYDAAKGSFGGHQASLMVVQMKRVGDKLTVRSSNRSSDFVIYVPPSTGDCAESAGGPIPKGSFAKLALAVAAERLKIVAGKVPADQPELAAALSKAQKGMEDLLDGIEAVMNDPRSKVPLSAADGTTEYLNEADVAWLDARYAAFLGKLEQPGASEPTSFLPPVPTASAAPSSACIENVQEYFKSTPAMSEYVVKLCNLTDPDSPLLPKADSEQWVNGYYLLQLNISLILDMAVKDAKWGIAGQISAAAAFSMFADLAIEGKLPDMGAFANIGIALSGELGDKLLKKYGLKAVLGDVLLAVEVWDQLCKAVQHKLKCLKSDEIVIGVRDIIIDIGERMVDGLLTPLVDAALIPDYSKAFDLDPVGLENGGYDDIVNVKPPPEPEPVPEPPPQPSPAPYSDDDITPIPTPPAPTPPAPLPKPLSCQEEKEASLKQCQADCPPEQDIEEYNACTAGCSSLRDLIAKSNCVNGCIGARNKAASARSSCITACLNAYYDTVCP